MFRWRLMLRSLFGSCRQQSKARRVRTMVRPKVEVLEDRTVPSAAPANALAIVSVASPPPVPSLVTITLYAQTSMNRWMQLLATVQQDIGNAFNALGQEIAQEVSSVQRQWGYLLGINPTSPNPSLNSTVPQLGSDNGAGTGNASGSGSGSNATTVHEGTSQQGGRKVQPMTSGGGVTSTTIGGFGGFGSATVSGQVWLDNNGNGL
ncbi:MAG TPA: hypothetical protein VH592_06915 [Gemmataceae bacterium]